MLQFSSNLFVNVFHACLQLIAKAERMRLEKTQQTSKHIRFSEDN